MRHAFAILTTLTAISACNTVTVSVQCPPFPKPAHAVAARVSALAHADPAGVGIWWHELAQFDAKCDALAGRPVPLTPPAGVGSP